MNWVATVNDTSVLNEDPENAIDLDISSMFNGASPDAKYLEIDLTESEYVTGFLVSAPFPPNTDVKVRITVGMDQSNREECFVGLVTSPQIGPYDIACSQTIKGRFITIENSHPTEHGLMISDVAIKIKGYRGKKSRFSLNLSILKQIGLQMNILPLLIVKRQS